MCYTGKCKYEIKVGEHVGDCGVPLADEKVPYPEDAFCAIQDRQIEEHNLTEKEDRPDGENF